MLVLSKVAVVRRVSLNCMVLLSPVVVHGVRVHNWLRHILALNMVLRPPTIWNFILQSSPHAIRHLFNDFVLLSHMALYWCDVMRGVFMLYNFVIGV